MDPLAILGLIQLGTSILGGLNAQRAAEDQQRRMFAAMDAQAQAAIGAVNAATQLANRDFTGRLTPYYSALLGRSLQGARAEAGASGLINSGLATQAAADIRSQADAALMRDLANLDYQKMLPLLQAQSALANVYGQQAGMNAQLMQLYGQMGPDLSWLPILASARPDVLNRMFDFGRLFGGLFGGGGASGGTPGAPGDVIPSRFV